MLVMVSLLIIKGIYLFIVTGSKIEDILLEDPDSTSIGDLKTIIHEKFGVPIDAQKLIFKGQY